MFVVYLIYQQSASIWRVTCLSRESSNFAHFSSLSSIVPGELSVSSSVISTVLLSPQTIYNRLFKFFFHSLSFFRIILQITNFSCGLILSPSFISLSCLLQGISKTVICEDYRKSVKDCSVKMYTSVALYDEQHDPFRVEGSARPSVLFFADSNDFRGCDHGVYLNRGVHADLFFVILS